MEANDTAFGLGGWRVWWLPKGASKPIEVDRGSSPAAGGPPQVALDDQRLVWAGFDEPASGSFSFLRVADLGSIGRIDTVLKLPIAEGLLWDPVLDGNLVWYAVIHADFDQTGVGDEFHIESMDLSSAEHPRERFAGTANDFEPAVSASAIVWKTVAPEFAALNWGELHVLDRSSNAMTTIPVDLAKKPSVGERFATFEEFSGQRLLVYDLSRRALVDLSSSLPADTETVRLESISGSLLVCALGVGGATSRIAWAQLP